MAICGRVLPLGSQSTHSLLSFSLSLLLPMAASSVFTGLSQSVCLFLFCVSSRYCCTALRTAFSTSLLLRLSNSDSSGSAPLFSPTHHNRQKSVNQYRWGKSTQCTPMGNSSSILLTHLVLKSKLIWGHLGTGFQLPADCLREGAARRQIYSCITGMVSGSFVAHLFASLV